MEEKESHRTVSLKDSAPLKNCVSVEDHERLKLYVQVLEHTRTDLMSVNQELYEKCQALLRGQDVLIEELEKVKAKLIETGAFLIFPPKTSSEPPPDSL